MNLEENKMSEKIDESVVEEIRACSSKRNSKQCIDKIFKEHEIAPEEQREILIQALRNKEVEHGEKQNK